MRRNFTVPYRPNWRQNTSLAGWVNWMQKWNRFISTSDRSDFYRTNVFILKHSHCSKQLTSLCLNSKSQICQNWKWIHFILHSIDSAREASENTFAVRQLEFSANITIVECFSLTWKFLVITIFFYTIQQHHYRVKAAVLSV